MKLRKKRLIPFFAAVALLASAVLPFFSVYALPAEGAAAQSQSLASIFGEKMLICTKDGFKWVSLKDIESGKEHPSPHPQYQCGICYVSAHGTKDFTPAQLHAFAFTTLASDASPTWLYGTNLTARLLSQNHHSRAPPTLSVT